LQEINSVILLYLTVCLIQIRQIKYLNNRVEQDHRSIKRIVKPMLGLKSYASASATLAGIELCQKNCIAASLSRCGDSIKSMVYRLCTRLDTDKEAGCA